MAIPQAVRSRVNVRWQRGAPLAGVALGGGIGTIVLALIPIGLVVGQVVRLSEACDRCGAAPASSGLSRNEFDDGGSAIGWYPAERQAYTDAGGRDAAGARALDLAGRAMRLAGYSAMVDTMLAEGDGDRTPSTCRRLAPSGAEPPGGVPPPLPGADLPTLRAADVSPVGLRLSDGADQPGTEGTDLPTPDPDAVAGRIEEVEARQAAIVRCLIEAETTRVARVRNALFATGLPSQTWSGETGMGGPFTPVPGNALGSELEAAATFLREARAEVTRLDAAAARMPLRNPMDGQVEVTSSFGVRLDPFYGRAALHTGVDLVGAAGTAVAATAVGTVTAAGLSGGYGNMVEIDHGHGLVTRYAHLSSVNVVPGQRVAAGDVVGRVGASGRATGPHLHYETRVDGEAVDPARFLKAGAMLLAARDRP